MVHHSKHWYVNRYYDEIGIPHYHGVPSGWPTLKIANANIRFTSLAVETDLVYGPCTRDEMDEYMEDVSVFPIDDEEGNTGTPDWLE